MSILAIVAVVVLVWLVVFAFALGLCGAAHMGDEQEGIDA